MDGLIRCLSADVYYTMKYEATHTQDSLAHRHSI